ADMRGKVRLLGDASPSRDHPSTFVRSVLQCCHLMFSDDEGSRRTMVRAAQSQTSEIAIFGRLLRNSKGQMSRSLARYVLTLGFSDDERSRVQDLATRNQEGTLSAEQKEELHHYVQAGHLLALLHSEARRTLNKQGS